MKAITVFAAASLLSGFASALPYMGPGPLVEMREQGSADDTSKWADLRGKVNILNRDG